MNTLTKKPKRNSRAFALLFSIVVISVIITTTLAVSALVRRGLDMAAIGERSMRAFFAASSGLECALYWDIRRRTADNASPFRRGANDTFSTNNISCLGQNVTVENHLTLPNTRRFQISHQGVCASVEVQLLNPPDFMRTEARSSGFSGECFVPGVIERGLDAEY